MNVHASGHYDDPRNLRVCGRTINTPFDGRPEDENDVTVSAGQHGEIRTKRPCLRTVSNGGPTTAHLNAIIVIVFDDPPCGPGDSCTVYVCEVGGGDGEVVADRHWSPRPPGPAPPLCRPRIRPAPRFFLWDATTWGTTAAPNPYCAAVVFVNHQRPRSSYETCRNRFFRHKTFIFSNYFSFI